jgi:hypothetical protein
MVVRCMEIQNRPLATSGLCSWLYVVIQETFLCGPWLVVRSCIKKRTHRVRVVGSHFVADQSRWV